MKHLSMAHVSTKLVAKNTVVDAVGDDAGQVWLTWAPLAKKDMEPSEQLLLDCSAPASQKLVTDWTEGSV